MAAVDSKDASPTSVPTPSAAGAKVGADEQKKGKQQKVIGMIGGIAWASSMEYYKYFNEEVNRRLGKGHSSRCVLWSVELQEYCDALNVNDLHKVRQIICQAAARVGNSGADFLVICSNTAHLACGAIQRSLPTLPILHIGDCTARAIKRLGFNRCGFIGTKMAMENTEIQIERLKLHGLDVIVPSDSAVRAKLWAIIEKELSVNVFSTAAKAYYVRVIEEMAAQSGVQCVILGCTELPLLIAQNDTKVPLIDTTHIHARAAIDVQLGVEQIDSFLPPSLSVEKPAPKKKKPTGATTAAATATATATAPKPDPTTLPASST